MRRYKIPEGIGIKLDVMGTELLQRGQQAPEVRTLQIYSRGLFRTKKNGRCTANFWVLQVLSKNPIFLPAEELLRGR